MNKEVCRPLEKILGYYPLTQPSDDIDDAYNKAMLKFKSEHNQKIKKDIDQAQQLISTNTQSIHSIVSTIDSAINGMLSLSRDNVTLPLAIECNKILKK